MNYLKKAASVLLAVLLFGFTFAGCELTLNDTDTVAAVYEKEQIQMDEAKLYVYESQRQIEADNDFLIVYYYGGFDTFWGDSWGYNLTSAMQVLFQTKYLSDLAKKAGMTLTAEEAARVEAGIERFKVNSAKAIQLAGADDSLIRQYVEENALAIKYYMELIKDVDTTMDEATFHRKSLVGVTITPATERPTEKPSTEEEPTQNPAWGYSSEAPETTEAETYSEAERSVILSQTLEDVQVLFESGKTASEIVEYYRENPEVTVTSITPFSVSSVDGMTDSSGVYTSYREFAWEMKTGEVRGEIITSSSGLKNGYVLLCENDDDPDARKAAEDVELESRKAALFAEKIQELLKKAPTFHVYEKKVESIRYKYALYESELLTPTTTEAEASAEAEATGESGTAAN